MIELCICNGTYEVYYVTESAKLFPRRNGTLEPKTTKETSNVLTRNGLYHFSADMYFTFKQFLNNSKRSLQNNGLTMSDEESVVLNVFLQTLYEMYQEQMFR